MDPAPRPEHVLRREALPPRSRNGFYAPIAALSSVMLMTIASLAIVVVPHTHYPRERVREHRASPPPAPRVRVIEAIPVERSPAMPIPNLAPVAPEAINQLCRSPVYRAGPEGGNEMVFEVCSDATLPTVIHID